MVGIRRMVGVLLNHSWIFLNAEIFFEKPH